MDRLPPLALYIHFPWCVRKCPYCDFNSYPLGGDLPESDYIDALLADLKEGLPELGGRRPLSLFLGGGTPSLFSLAALGRLLEGVDRLLPWATEAEITLEANPGTLRENDFAALRALGINRLSLGVQSFNPAALRRLERIHGAEDARRAAHAARQHFERYNLDLMYGLPGQTLAQAVDDIETALALEPDHLSCYQLTLEPETRFGTRPPPGMPEDEVCADMQEAIEARLATAGYEHYETSAFARPGCACRHNLNYWQFGDYLGIGAGAHAKLTGPAGIVRQARWAHPADYLRQTGRGAAVAEQFTVGPEDLPLEFLMNALRLNGGFQRALFVERTGLPWPVIEPEIRRAESEGLLVVDERCVVPTRRGQRFLNVLLARMMHDGVENAG